MSGLLTGIGGALGFHGTELNGDETHADISCLVRFLSRFAGGRGGLKCKKSFNYIVVYIKS